MILFFTLLILMIGAVSATDVTNTTNNHHNLENTENTNYNISNLNLSTTENPEHNQVKLDNYTNSNNNTLSVSNNQSLKETTFSVTEDTYSTYFDSEGKTITTTVHSGDTLDLSGTFTGKTFDLTVPCTLTSSQNNANLIDSTVKIEQSASGSSVSNLHIQNSNEIIGLVIDTSENNTVTNNFINTTGFTLIVSSSNNNKISKNYLSSNPYSGIITHSTLVLVLSNNTSIDDNIVETAGSANSIYLCIYSAGDYTGGPCYYNNITNNKISTTISNPSAYNYAICVFGSYNLVEGNTINDAYAGIIINRPYNNVIGNTLNNIKGTTDYGSSTIVATNSIISNNILNNCISGIISTNSNVTGNTINTPLGIGITLQGTLFNVSSNNINSKEGISYSQTGKTATTGIIENNNITSADSYTIDIKGVKNVTVINNYLIANGSYGDNSVLKTDNDTVVNNTPIDTKITGNYGGNVYTINLTDSYGNPLSQTVSYIIKNNENKTVKTSNVNTGNDGLSLIDLSSLTNGIYTINYTYPGNTYYITSSNNDTFNISNVKSKINTTVKVDNVNLAYGESGVLIVNINSADNSTVNEGTVTITISGTTLTENISNGASSFNLPLENVGTYPISINYNGTSNYNPCNGSAVLTVNNVVISKVSTSINANNLTLKYGENGTLTVNVVSSDKSTINTGNVIITLNNGTKYTVNVKNNQAIFNIEAMNIGSSLINIVYSGDSNYKSSSTTSNLIVNKEDVSVSVPNITSGSSKIVNITINVTSGNGKIIGSGNVTVFFNGETKTLNVTNGTVIFNTKLPDNNGVYALNVKYNGNNVYNAAMGNGTVTVNVNNSTKLIGSDFVEVYGAGENYTVTLLDCNGEPIVGQHIAFNLTRLSNGASKVYWATTDINGKANLQINLGLGNYTAQVYYAGNSKYSASNVNNSISVKADNLTSSVLTANKFNRTVGAGDNFTGKLTDINGNPIVGQHIALNLTRLSNKLSKVYWVTTDTNGEYQLAINLGIGEYSVISSYSGNKVYSSSTCSTTISVHA